MFPTPGLYDLTPKPGRQRFGIARKPFQPPRRINVASPNTLNMPPKIAAKASKVVKHEEPEEDILRAPESDSDSSDDNLGVPMYKSTFVTGSSQPEPSNKNTTKGTAKAATINGKATSNGTRKSTRTTIPSIQESGLSSPKRKRQEQPSSLGSGMFDEFGRKINKKQKTTKTGYGSKPSSQVRTYGSQAKKEDTPPKTFQAFDTSFGDSDDSPVKKFDVKSPEKGTPQETPSKALRYSNRFKVHSVAASPSTPGSTKQEMKLSSIDSPSSPLSPQKSFIAIAGVDSSPIKGDEGSAFVNPDTSFTSESQRSPVTKRPLRGKKKKNNQKDELPSLTQLPGFVEVEGLSELLGTARDMVDTDIEAPKFDLDEDDSIAMTQRTRCPMCRKPVDADDLKAFGTMDTRKQEQFCQSHQKKTAMDEWDEKGYPEIDWENFDARISKHHKFIKKLINGGKSYYRDRLQEAVDEGKDRNLLKSNANLTPGYFGGRGLRVMSENIMHEFTPLLKKRAVKDKLVAARTVAGFVQSVCVQEVAVLMIMEDMEVEVEEAREVLEDSAGVGELINEEIREVVTKKADNSEDEGSDENE